MRVCALALWASVATLPGCDTVARLAFLDNEFNDVQTLGLTPPAGQCAGTTDGGAVLRFVLLDSQRNTIGPEDSLGSRQVDFGGSGSLVLSNAALFELPDEACMEGDMCGQPNLACQFAPTISSDEEGLRRCSRGTGVALRGNPTFVGSRDKELVYAVLIENTSSLTGRLPEAFGSLFPDRDGNGMTDQQWTTQTLQEPARATDALGGRNVMALRMASSWKDMAERAVRTRNRDVWFGMWTFGDGTSGLRSMLPGDAQLTRAGSGAVSEGGAVDQAVQQYFNVSAQPQTQKASVYEAMANVINNVNALGRPEIASAPKALVVFVDGPDELRNKMLSAQKVIDDAKAKGVRVYIVHLDSAVEVASPAGEPYFPDLPDYVEAQRDDACVTDADCRNYEECRPTTGYATASGQTPTLPANVDLTKSYCHIKRGSDGRVGPIDEYARIACETGGGYIYMPSPGGSDELGERAGWLPFVLDGLWEAPVVFDSLQRGEVAGGQGYKVQLDVSATVLGVQKPQSMSQLGLQRGQGDARDSRLVLFSAAP
jgi:hypothetical protein